MPELPEVEDAARRLREAAVGRTIAAAKALHPSLGRSLTPAACRRLAGRRIVEVARRAKIQLVTFDDGQLLEVHFRMTGDWAFGAAADAPPPYERVRLTCTDGTRVSLVDSRALSVMRVHAPGAFQLPALGPEPLTEAFTAVGLRDALASRRGPIKPVLLDQKVVAGIGNIYAAEALWEARIHPASRADTLSLARVTRLVDAIRVVLRRARGRALPHDGAVRCDAGIPGLRSRGSSAVVRDDGMVRRIVQAGRSTYFCAACQRR